MAGGFVGFNWVVGGVFDEGEQVDLDEYEERSLRVQWV